MLTTLHAALLPKGDPSGGHHQHPLLVLEPRPDRSLASLCPLRLGYDRLLGSICGDLCLSLGHCSRLRDFWEEMPQMALNACNLQVTHKLREVNVPLSERGYIYECKLI